MIRNTDQSLVKAKEELSLKIKKKEKAEAEVAEMKKQVSRQLREAKDQAMEEFNASLEMKDIKVKFN